MNLKHGCFSLVLALAAISCESALAVVTGQYLLDGNANDSSGFNRNGAIVGSPATAPGLYMGSAGSLDFNGTDQSIQLPDNTDFVRNTPGATLLAWIRPDVIGTGRPYNPGRE